MNRWKRNDMGMWERHIRTRHFKAGYEIRYREIKETQRSTPFVMKTAYTPGGHYVGESKWAHRLIVKRGIKPELRNGCKVCSIGFCEREQKWYGWSHRAIYGFGIGDVVEEGDCAASSGFTQEWLDGHPEDDLSLPVGFEAKTIEDAKRMAVAFAESVG